MSVQNRFRRVAVVPKRVSAEALRAAAELADWLNRRGVEVALEKSIPSPGGRSATHIYDPGES
ncbi:MAG: hypothetical protein V3W50_06045, partial [Thermoanaerobaculia bacterium]